MKYLCLTILIISLLFGGKLLIDKSLAKKPQPPKPFVCDMNEKNLLKEINLVRGEPVKLNSTLDAFAEKRAKEIAVEFSHDNFKKVDPGDLGFKGLGENLLQSPNTGCIKPSDAIHGWLESPTHKKVMLRGDYKHIGIGIYQNHLVTIYGY